MSAQIITVAIQKGGVGKTTTAAVLAQAAAYRGKKVLCVDMDSQGNFSFALAASTRGAGSMDLLEGKPAQDLIQRTQGIDVIPACWNLAAATSYRGSARRLERALKPIENNYDYIFIDTPTQPGELQYNAMQAATALIIPLQADTYNIQSMYLTTDTAQQFKKSNPRLQIAGILFTRYTGKGNLDKSIRETIEREAAKAGAPTLGRVREGIAIREAAALQLSLYEYKPRSNPAQDYLEIFDKLEAQAAQEKQED